eukprot:2179853-Pyramimonas_sp.AAC.1
MKRRVHSQPDHSLSNQLARLAPWTCGDRPRPIHGARDPVARRFDVFNAPSHVCRKTSDSKNACML